jgi:two-component system phosphate regulon response regulator PhoB
MAAEVFIIHKDSALRENAVALLESAGYSVAGAATLEAARPTLKEAAPEGLLLPWTSDLAIRSALQELRVSSATDPTRVIVIAPKALIQDAFLSLEYGADDCLATPIVAEELIGRVTACLRRSRRTPEVSGKPSGIVLDRISHRLFVDDQYVDLSPTEFRLMAFFLENPGRMFTRDELLNHAWPVNVNASCRTVDVHVRRLRLNLEPHGYDHLIETVRGFGYRFSNGKPEVSAQSIAEVIDRPRL